MKNYEIRIRDPFIVPYDGKYYMFGTNGGYSAVCDSNGDSIGFDGYVSENLVDWSEPFPAFRKPDNFWASRDFWAPEIHEYKGAFYMFATFKGDNVHRGTAILKSEKIDGPYVEHSRGAVTPADWECLDGTLYVSPEGKPYMVFCHEWQQIHDGTVCYIELSEDLTHAVSEPVTLFNASSMPHVYPIRKTKDNFVTDGPFLYRCENGELLMLWSSFNENEDYFVSVLKSSNADITGTWTPCGDPLFSSDGGHCMLFKTFDGKLKLSLHRPNSQTEHLELFHIEENNGTIFVK